MGSCCPESEKMFWVKYKQESQPPGRPAQSSGWTRAVRCSLSVVRGKLCFSVHHNIHNMRPAAFSPAAGKVYLVHFSFKPFIFWHKNGSPVTDISKLVSIRKIIITREWVRGLIELTLICWCKKIAACRMGPDGAIFMDKVCRVDAAAALLLTDTHGQPGSTREMSHDYTSNMSHVTCHMSHGQPGSTREMSHDMTTPAACHIM